MPLHASMIEGRVAFAIALSQRFASGMFLV